MLLFSYFWDINLVFKHRLWGRQSNCMKPINTLYVQWTTHFIFTIKITSSYLQLHQINLCYQWVCQQPHLLKCNGGPRTMAAVESQVRIESSLTKMITKYSSMPSLIYNWLWRKLSEFHLIWLQIVHWLFNLIRKWVRVIENIEVFHNIYESKSVLLIMVKFIKQNRSIGLQIICYTPLA